MDGPSITDDARAAATAALAYAAQRLKPALKYGITSSHDDGDADADDDGDTDAAAPATDSEGLGRAVVLEHTELHFHQSPAGGYVDADTDADAPAITPQERADRCVVPSQPLAVLRVSNLPGGLYVDPSHALVAYLDLHSTYNPNSLLHALIVPCPELSGDTGVLLRFVAAMVNARLTDGRPNRYTNQLFLGILGRNIVVEAAFNLFLLRDKTYDSSTSSLRRFEAYRDNFPKSVFVDVSRCMWAHATVLEAAMTKWLVPEAAAAFVRKQARRTKTTDAVVETEVVETETETGPGDSLASIADSVLALAKSMPKHWIDASQQDHLLGDLLYHVAFLADEAACVDRAVPLVYFRVAACAAAGVRFTPRLFERLLRRFELVEPSQDFVASLGGAFTGSWVLQNNPAAYGALHDLIKLLVQRLPRRVDLGLAADGGAGSLGVEYVNRVLSDHFVALQLFAVMATSLNAVKPTEPDVYIRTCVETLRAEGALYEQLCTAIRVAAGAKYPSHVELRSAFVAAVASLTGRSSVAVAAA